MKKLNYALLTILASMVMFVSSCAFLDGLLNEPMKDLQGNQIYLDVKESEKTGTSVYVTEEDFVEGGEYEIVYSDRPSYLVKQGAQYAVNIPVIGGLVAGLLPGLVPLYNWLRGRKKLNAAHAAQEGTLFLLNEVMEVLKDYNDGKLDENADGSINMDEIGNYFKKKGLEKAMSIETYTRLMGVITSSLEDSAKQKAIAEILASLNK